MEFAMGSVGWQEAHVYASNVSVDNPQLYKEMVNLINKRVVCLGGNVVVKVVKASQEQLNRDVAYLKRSDIPVATNSGFPSGPNYPNNTSNWAFQSPHLSWPIKFSDAFQNGLAITYIAGMPAVVKQNGPGPYEVLPGAPVTAGSYLAIYAEYMISGPWGVASRTWPAGPFTAATGQPMTGIPVYHPATATSPPKIDFPITMPLSGIALTPGGWIRVGGLKYTSPQRIRLNGSYQAFNVGAGIITVLAPRVKVDPNFASIGYAQAATYAFEQYTRYTFDDITHRKRGRVVSSPAGRRSSR